MKRHHMYSWPLKRGFDFSEWCEFLKDHSSGDVVLTFCGFQFNVNGVCVNRHKLTKYGPGGRISFSVETWMEPEHEDERPLGHWRDEDNYGMVKFPQGWRYSLSMTDTSSGFGAGRSDEVYDTEDDAIRAGLRAMIKRYEAEVARYDGETEVDEDGRRHLTGKSDRMRSMLKIARDTLEEYQQLTLF